MPSSTMPLHLLYRPGRPADIAACTRLMPPFIGRHLKLVKPFQSLAERIALSRGLGFMVIEHVTAESSTICGFGMSCFISDDFAADLASSTEPYALAEVIRRSKDGSRPYLNESEIRAANSTDGLNLLVLAIGWADADEQFTRAVRAKLYESFLFKHCGYNLKIILQELFSESEATRAKAIGAPVVNDYSAYYDALPMQPTPEARPYLAGIRREDVVEGTNIASLFAFNPPRFRFSTGEQEQIEMALLDKTDREIAAALNVSHWTVLKRWQNIYAEVDSVAPELIGRLEAEIGSPGVNSEKRRRVFGYIRHHLEELRPYYS